MCVCVYLAIITCVFNVMKKIKMKCTATYALKTFGKQFSQVTAPKFGD